MSQELYLFLILEKIQMLFLKLYIHVNVNYQQLLRQQIRILGMIKRIFSESDQNYGKKKIKGENVKSLIQLNKNCFCSTTCRSSSESTLDVSLVNNKYLHFI